MRKAIKRESGYVLLLALCAVLAAIAGWRAYDAHNGQAVRVDEFRPPVSALIDINTADVPILVSLPGIGEKLAAKIIEGRPYASIEDIKRVDGISEKLYSGLRDRICTDRAGGEAPQG